MFSSSVLNNTAAGSSNPIHHHYPHNQHLQESARDHVPIDSTLTIISPSSGRASTGSAAADVAKKRSDNRSKIKTAQGLRDRRVRLSIGIARKFFDLQDLLEFDKPSKTVEWLLTKSNRAILELSAASSSEETATRDCCKSLSSSRSSNQAEQVSCDASFKTGKRKAALLARENARARARARTVAKLCAAKVDVDHQKFKLLNNPQVKNGGETSHFSANWYSSSSPSFLKSLASEEERNGVEQLEPPTYGLDPNLSLDWHISTQQSSSAAHILNLSRDMEMYSRSTWDQLLNHYRAL